MSRLLKTDLDCRGVSRVRNLPAPLVESDAVPKAYVDARQSPPGRAIALTILFG